MMSAYKRVFDTRLPAGSPATLSCGGDTCAILSGAQVSLQETGIHSTIEDAPKGAAPVSFDLRDELGADARPAA